MGAINPRTMMEKLERAEDTLNQLKLRYYLLHAFQDEFTRVVGRRRIDIHNDHIWTMAFDTRDALALHLASWSKGLTGPGGLFRQLKQHFKKLYVPKSVAEANEGRRYAFTRLFPAAVARNRILVSDVDALEARFRQVVSRVRNDRNKTVAHMYEHKAQLSRRLLTPRGYATVFKRVESLLNDIRVVVDNSSRAYSNLSWVNSKTVAEDLVDMILSGTISQVLYDFGIQDRLEQAQAPYYWQSRAEFHARACRSRRKTATSKEAKQRPAAKAPRSTTRTAPT
jgi:hypothetical protein